MNTSSVLRGAGRWPGFGWLCLAALLAVWLPHATQVVAANGPAQLVKDITPTSDTTLDSSPTAFVTIGNATYFTATDASNGLELWKTDGSAAGTLLVKDINPGPASAFSGINQQNFVFNMVNVAGTLFFNTDGVLWKSDGTAAGTVELHRFPFGYSDTPTRLQSFTAVQGTLFFIATDNQGKISLWKSNGTSSGTVLVKTFASDGDIYQTTPVHDLVAVQGTLFFAAYKQLWQSDGTPSGTRVLKDLIAHSLTAVQGRLFFAGYPPPGHYSDPNLPGGLWTSDGTAVGTHLISSVSVILGLQVLGSTMFFFGDDDTNNGYGVWRSDGTAAGTTLLLSENSYEMRVLNNTLYFFSRHSGNFELWQSDGTVGGTTQVTHFGFEYPQRSLSTLLQVNNQVVFLRSTPGSTRTTRDIVRSDGVVITPSDVNVDPRSFGVVNNKLVFAASDLVHGNELWASDGTAAGTALVRDLYAANGDSALSNFVDLNGTLLFLAHNGGQLWRSDGTAAGTTLLQDGCSGRCYTDFALDLVKIGNVVFFRSRDSAHGYELWRSDGTAAGTFMVSDICAGERESNPHSLVTFNGTLYFSANDCVHGLELWKSDGTATGTVMVGDLQNGQNYYGPEKLYATTNALYFVPNTTIDRQSLWKSDGTINGTTRLVDFPNFEVSLIHPIGAINDTLFFVVLADSKGQELWKTNGTSSGTKMVQHLSTTGYNLDQHTVSATALWYVVRDLGSGSSLWKADPQSSGASLVRSFPENDRNPFGQAAVTIDTVSHLVAANGTVFFLGRDASAGNNLWKTDGTSGGTIKLTTFTGAAAAQMNALGVVPARNRVLLAADDGMTGLELWQNDGTTQGTRQIQDLAPGAASASPNAMFVAGDHVFFIADDNQTGRELWAMPIAGIDTPYTPATPIPPTTTVPVNGTSTPVVTTPTTTVPVNGTPTPVVSAPTPTVDPAFPLQVTDTVVTSTMGGLITGVLSASAPDGTHLTFQIITNGTQGTARLTQPAGMQTAQAVTTASFSYTPFPGARGEDSFTFSVSDGTHTSNVGTVRVMLSGTNVFLPLLTR